MPQNESAQKANWNTAQSFQAASFLQRAEIGCSSAFEACLLKYREHLCSFWVQAHSLLNDPELIPELMSADVLAFIKVKAKQLSPAIFQMLRSKTSQNIFKHGEVRSPQWGLCGEIFGLKLALCFCFVLFSFPGLNDGANLMRIKTVKEPTKSFGYTATQRGSPEKEISSGCFADRRRLSVIKEILPLALRNPSKTLHWYISADTCSSWSFAIWQDWRADG